MISFITSILILYLILPYLILPYLTLLNLTLPYLILPYLTLPFLFSLLFSHSNSSIHTRSLPGGKDSHLPTQVTTNKTHVLMNIEAEIEIKNGFDYDYRYRHVYEN